MFNVTTLFAATGLTGSIPIFATVFGLVALAGGAAGYFKASRGDSIIKYQATEIGLRDGKIATLEKDLAASQQACSAKDDTIAELKTHNIYLQKLGQGSPQLKKLTAVVEKQALAVTALTNQVKGLLTRENKKK